MVIKTISKTGAYFAILLAFLILCGCSTSSNFKRVNPDVALPSQSTFFIGEITDNSNYVTDKPDEDAVFLMRNALLDELSKAKLVGDGYKINVVIHEYRPGNAFQRWLVPGWGQTRLNVKAEIFDKEGREIAVIPAERSVAAGGGFTIGAWKSCFRDVAKEIVKQLQREMESR